MSVRSRTGLEKLSDFVLSTELLWVAPLIVLLLFDSPYFWVGWILALIPWPLRLLRKGYLIPRTPFDIPILIFLAGVLVGLCFSDYLWLSLKAFQSCLGVVLAYYAVVDNNWSHHWKWWGALLCLLALLFSVFIFSQVPLDSPKVTPLNAWAIRLMPSLPQIFDFTPNINGLAIALGVVVPVLVGVALFGTRPSIRIGAALLGVIFSGILVLTCSRGGWISLGLALFVIALWRTRWSLLAVPIAAGLISWALISGFDLSTVVQLETKGSLLTRIHIWQATTLMLQDYPFTGCGLGAFQLVFPSYSAFSDYIPNPHSAYLMLYADTGLLGAIAAVFAGVVLVVLAVRMWRAPRSHPAYGFGVGILGSIVAGGVHSIFEVTIGGVWTNGAGGYHYIASPLLWLVAGTLVVAMRRQNIA